MGERFIPTDEHGRLLVNFLGPPKTFPHVSVTDVLAGRFEKGTFKDRIVLVGATAIGTHDLRSTPLSPVYPGIEIHATVIDNIVTGVPREARLVEGLRPARHRRPGGGDRARAPADARAHGAPVLGGTLRPLCPRSPAGCSCARGVWLDLVYPLLALSVNYLALTVYYYVSEERQRKQIKETFRQYVAPARGRGDAQGSGTVEAGRGGEGPDRPLQRPRGIHHATPSGIRPHEMIDMLQRVLRAGMTEQIFANQGTLKEYVGDELMAIFGAPSSRADHAARACAAALAMRDARHALGVDGLGSAARVLEARTGINSGPHAGGEPGLRYRFAYGVLGDQVNLGLPPGRAQPSLRDRDPHRGEHRPAGRRSLRAARGGHGSREGADPGRAHLRAPGQRPAPPYRREQDEALHLYAAALEAYRKQLWGDALGLFDAIPRPLAGGRAFPGHGGALPESTVTRVRRKTGMECLSSS